MTEERRLGSRYRLQEMVGRGAMGEVWRGVDQNGATVAVKLLLPQWSQDPAMIARFVQERSVLTGIRSPYVVQIRDMVVEGDAMGIVMDYVDGPDLRTHLGRVGSMAPREVSRLGANVARGLHELHGHSVVHRDIKPENVLLAGESGDWEPRLTDFGIARINDASTRQATALVGTPNYMAPELADGAAPSPHSDLYALGILLYELCCGVTPFQGNPLAVMQAHATLVPGRPAGLPDELWDVIAWLLRRDPTGRPQGAGQVAAALDGVSPQLVGRPPAPALSSPPPGVPQARQGTTFLGAATPPRSDTVLASPGSSIPPVGRAPTGQAPNVPPATAYVGDPGVQRTTAMPGGQQRWNGAGAGGALPPAPPQKKSSLPLILAGLVAIALAAFGATRVLGSDEAAKSPVSTAPAAAQTPQGATTQATSQTQAAQQNTTTAAAPVTTQRVIQLPAGATTCQQSGTAEPYTNVASGNARTTCPFAVQVLTDYRSNGGKGGSASFVSYSPVTDQRYPMTCTGGDVVTCTGGNGAVVLIW
ncbi:protein kinase [Luteococcus sp. H138]|uniref:serine/threonine-protein kinase n=1 Tax=unclassified Luteococcus TaxID=2639923 RepID=UPI00313A9540